MNNLETKRERYSVLVSRILTNRATFVKTIYQIGLDLKEIKERELYLFEFRTFDEFIEKKVNISRTNTYRCMSIAEKHSLREFNVWGMSKLEIIDKELKEDSKEFMKSANPNVGTRQLPDDIDEFKLEKGISDINKYKSQVGKTPNYSDSQDELDFKLIRQIPQILEFKESFKETLTNWLVGAKTSRHEKVKVVEKQFEKMLEDLK